MASESKSNTTLLDAGGLILTTFKASFMANSYALRTEVLSGSLVFFIFNE